MVGAFIDGIKLKKELEAESISQNKKDRGKVMCDQVHSVIYNYTKRSMERLLRKSEFNLIFRLFLESFDTSTEESDEISESEPEAYERALDGAI